MFSVSEYITDSKFGGNVICLTFRVTGDEMQLGDKEIHEAAKTEIENFFQTHDTLTGKENLTGYSSWIDRKYRLMSFTTEGF